MVLVPQGCKRSHCTHPILDVHVLDNVASDYSSVFVTTSRSPGVLATNRDKVLHQRDANPGKAMNWQKDMSQKVMGLNLSTVKDFSFKISITENLYNHLVVDFYIIEV